MHLYLIRHAQSVNNAIWAETGSDDGRHPDPALTDLGHRQASALADYLAARWQPTPAAADSDPVNRRGFHFTHLYTSLMQRAVATGSAIAERLEIPLVAWEEIHEFGGIFAKDPETGERVGLPGPNRDYFARHFPALVLPETLGETGWWSRPYEPFEEMLTRAERFLAELHERHDADDRVAIVSHGGFITATLRALLDYRPPEDGSARKGVWIHANNTAVTRLEFTDTVNKLVYLNRLEHLDADLVT
jgi:2,3-bisphosphoglycerate-dependent phosphoglycerate mutase